MITASNVYVVGHRGAAGVMPENTLKGFRYAMALGVDAVECDLHLSRDQQLLVLHDSTVDRTTNGHGAVRDLKAARIRSLDAGEGEQVPTFDEVLETVRHEVHLLVELKGIGVERAAVAAVTRHGMVDDVTFSSFSLERLAAVRALGDHYRVRAILPNPTDFELARAAALKAVGIDVRYTNCCLRVIAAAHALGLEVLAWNPDTWHEQQAMIALGVDGVSSNRPDLLLERLGRTRVVPEMEVDVEADGEIAEAVEVLAPFALAEGWAEEVVDGDGLGANDTATDDTATDDTATDDTTTDDTATDDTATDDTATDDTATDDTEISDMEEGDRHS